MINDPRLQKILARLRSNYANETIDWTTASPHVLWLAILHEVASEVEVAFAADHAHQTSLTENPALLALRSFLDRGASVTPMPAVVHAVFSALVPLSDPGTNDIEFSPRVQAGTSVASKDGTSMSALRDFDFEVGHIVEYIDGETKLQLGELGISPTLVTVGSQAFQARYRAVRCAIADSVETIETVSLADTSRAPLILTINGAFQSVFIADPAHRWDKVPRWSAAMHPNAYMEYYDATNDRLHIMFSNGDFARRPLNGSTLTIRYLKTNTISDSSPTTANAGVVYTPDLPSPLEFGLSSTRKQAMVISNGSVDVETITKVSAPRFFEGADLQEMITKPMTQEIGGPLVLGDLRAATEGRIGFEIGDVYFDNNKSIIHVWKQGGDANLHPLQTLERDSLVQALHSSRWHGAAGMEIRSGLVLNMTISVHRIPGKNISTLSIRDKLNAQRDANPELLNLSAVNEPFVTNLSISYADPSISNHKALLRHVSHLVYKIEPEARYNVVAVRIVEG